MTKTPEEILAANPHLRDLLSIKWTSYIPHAPTPKQRLFLSLPQKEAFFGGAAGGGKSDALLMAALQYVDVPGYAAIIFRRTFTDLQLPDALIQRSHEWLANSDAEYKSAIHTWTFPSGARLAFGYLSDEQKKFRYQGAAFQFIGFDELTQFYEDDYLYLHSRLRRTKCPFHEGFRDKISGEAQPKPMDPKCSICREYSALSKTPLRIRGAANPGGIGHLWVKQRYDIGPVIESHNELGHPIYAQHPKTKKRIFAGRNPDRPYIPSLLLDNPYLDQEEYAESLANLDSVTREQLLSGDWAISSDGRFRKEWAKYYTESPPYYILHTDPHTSKGRSINPADCQKFITVDPAASAREGPGDHQIFRGAPSYSVISTWLLTHDHQLIWKDMHRCRVELPELYAKIKEIYVRERPEWVGIENSGLGIGIYQAVHRAGISVRPLKPRSMDKLVRATDAINRMEQGRIWFPRYAAWLDDAESEIFSWTAHPHEPADIIDTLAYAAMYVSTQAAHAHGEDTITYTPNMMYEMTPDVIV